MIVSIFQKSRRYEESTFYRTTISHKFPCSKKYFNYFSGYKNDEEDRLLSIMLLEKSGYIKYHDKALPLLITVSICKKEKKKKKNPNNIMQKGLENDPVYSKKCIKNKIGCY